MQKELPSKKTNIRHEASFFLSSFFPRIADDLLNYRKFSPSPTWIHHHLIILPLKRPDMLLISNSIYFSYGSNEGASSNQPRVFHQNWQGGAQQVGDEQHSHQDQGSPKQVKFNPPKQPQNGDAEASLHPRQRLSCLSIRPTHEQQDDPQEESRCFTERMRQPSG